MPDFITANSTTNYIAILSLIVSFAVPLISGCIKRKKHEEDMLKKNEERKESLIKLANESKHLFDEINRDTNLSSNDKAIKFYKESRFLDGMDVYHSMNKLPRAKKNTKLFKSNQSVIELREIIYRSRTLARNANKEYRKNSNFASQNSVNLAQIATDLDNARTKLGNSRINNK